MSFILPYSDPCICKEVRRKLSVWHGLIWGKFLFHIIDWADIIINDAYKSSTSLKNSFACCANKKGKYWARYSIVPRLKITDCKASVHNHHNAKVYRKPKQDDYGLLLWNSKRVFKWILKYRSSMAFFLWSLCSCQLRCRLEETGFKGGCFESHAGSREQRTSSLGLLAWAVISMHWQRNSKNFYKFTDFLPVVRLKSRCRAVKMSDICLSMP